MTFSVKGGNNTDLIKSNDMKYVFDDSILEEVRSVVRINIKGHDWFMDYDEFIGAKNDGRNNPVICGDKLILVNDEDYNELKKLELWLKNNKII
jgi:hypothetical protein